MDSSGARSGRLLNWERYCNKYIEEGALCVPAQPRPLTYEVELAPVTSAIISRPVRAQRHLTYLLFLFLFSVFFSFFLYSPSRFNKRQRGTFNPPLLLMVYWLCWLLYISIHGRSWRGMLLAVPRQQLQHRRGMPTGPRTLHLRQT